MERDAVLFDVGEPKPIPPPPVFPPEPPKAEEPDRTIPMVFSPPLAGAAFSPCGLFRYHLWRIFSMDKSRPSVLWIVHNPSVADAEFDDNSVKRMISFSQREGARRMDVVNKDAFVTTYPKELHARAKAGLDIFGPDNLKHIANRLNLADLVIAAWGASDTGSDGREFFTKLRTMYDGEIYSLGVTKRGDPRHPLRLSSRTPLVRFDYKAVDAPSGWEPF